MERRRWDMSVNETTLYQGHHVGKEKVDNYRSKYGLQDVALVHTELTVMANQKPFLSNLIQM